VPPAVPAAPASDIATVDQFPLNLHTPFDFAGHLNLDQQHNQSDDSITPQHDSRNQLTNLLDAEKNKTHFAPGTSMRSDATCFFIRNYLMVRDDPKSDSVHGGGYTTCVPSVRFRVYTTDERR
jgi:hypothetical protein